MLGLLYPASILYHTCLRLRSSSGQGDKGACPHIQSTCWVHPWSRWLWGSPTASYLSFAKRWSRSCLTPFGKNISIVNGIKTFGFQQCCLLTAALDNFLYWTWRGLNQKWFSDWRDESSTTMHQYPSPEICFSNAVKPNVLKGQSSKMYNDCGSVFSLPKEKICLRVAPLLL